MDPIKPGDERRVLWVGDHALDLTEFHLEPYVAVRANQHGHAAEPVDRHGQRQSTGSRAHQDADVLALAHADRDQATDDVVDPLVGLLGGVGAILEQEERLIR